MSLHSAISKQTRGSNVPTMESESELPPSYFTYTDPVTDLIVQAPLLQALSSFSPRRCLNYNANADTPVMSVPTLKRHVVDPMLEMEAPLEHSRAVEAVQGECVPMVPWHTESRPNCNMLHEVDIPTSLASRMAVFATEDSNTKVTSWDHSTLEKMEAWADFLGQGWFRQAWELQPHTNTPLLETSQEEEEDNVILKMLRYERDYFDEYYDLHRRDAMAMERLTASPYTLNVYGYCGQSAMNEKAVDNVERVFMRLRKGHYDYKLQTATAVAWAVSDMHRIDFDKGNNATLVHYDLNPRNVAIMPNGAPKLNDFNVAEFLRWNTTASAPCGFQGRLFEPWVSFFIMWLCVCGSCVN
jgi:hypothetical protein